MNYYYTAQSCISAEKTLYCEAKCKFSSHLYKCTMTLAFMGKKQQPSNTGFSLILRGIIIISKIATNS